MLVFRYLMSHVETVTYRNHSELSAIGTSTYSGWTYWHLVCTVPLVVFPMVIGYWVYVYFFLFTLLFSTLYTFFFILQLINGNWFHIKRWITDHQIFAINFVTYYNGLTVIGCFRIHLISQMQFHCFHYHSPSLLQSFALGLQLFCIFSNHRLLVLSTDRLIHGLGHFSRFLMSI